MSFEPGNSRWSRHGRRLALALRRAEAGLAGAQQQRTNVQRRESAERAVGCGLVLMAESFDTGTPTGKFALTMFAAMAELEASTITERVMSGKRQKATQGGYNGAPTPLGYDYAAGAFTPNADAVVVRCIFTEFVAGRTLSAIAQGLNTAGIATVRGGQWYASTVRYILNNGFYAGLAQYGEVEAEGEHPALVARDIYAAAHDRLLALRPGPVRDAPFTCFGRPPLV